MNVDQAGKAPARSFVPFRRKFLRSSSALILREFFGGSLMIVGFVYAGVRISESKCSDLSPKVPANQRFSKFVSGKTILTNFDLLLVAFRLMFSPSPNREAVARRRSKHRKQETDGLAEVKPLPTVVSKIGRPSVTTTVCSK